MADDPSQRAFDLAFGGAPQMGGLAVADVEEGDWSQRAEDLAFGGQDAMQWLPPANDWTAADPQGIGSDWRDQEDGVSQQAMPSFPAIQRDAQPAGNQSMPGLATPDALPERSTSYLFGPEWVLNDLDAPSRNRVVNARRKLARWMQPPKQKADSWDNVQSMRREVMEDADMVDPDSLRQSGTILEYLKTDPHKRVFVVNKLENLTKELQQRMAAGGSMLDAKSRSTLTQIQQHVSRIKQESGGSLKLDDPLEMLDLVTTKYGQRSRERQQWLQDAEVAEARASNPTLLAGNELGGIGQGILGAGVGLASPIMRAVGQGAEADRIQDRMGVLQEAQQRNVADQNYGPVSGFLNRNVPSVTQSGVQALALAPFGFGAMAGGFGVTTANDSYRQAIRSGLSEREALKYGVVEGAIEAGVMSVFQAAGKYIPGLGGFEEKLTKGITRKVTQESFGKTFSRFSLEVNAELAEEISTSIAQQLNTAMTLPGAEGDMRILDAKGNIDWNAPLTKTLVSTIEQTLLTMGLAEGAQQAIARFKVAPTRNNYDGLPMSHKTLEPDGPTKVRESEQQRREYAEQLEVPEASGAPQVDFPEITRDETTSQGEGVIADGKGQEEAAQDVLTSTEDKTAAGAGVWSAPALDPNDEAFQQLMQGFDEESPAQVEQGMTPPDVAGSQDATVSATASPQTWDQQIEEAVQAQDANRAAREAPQVAQPASSLPTGRLDPQQPDTPSPIPPGAAGAAGQVSPQDYSVESIKEAFNLTDEQAVALDALVRSIGLDTSRIKVAKGGTAGSGALFQDGKQVQFKDNILESLKTWQNRGTPEQLKAHIAKTKGAKEYADWIGLDAFLKDKPSVTKAQVEAFVRANQVTVQEVTKGGAKDLSRDMKYYLEQEGTRQPSHPDDWERLSRRLEGIAQQWQTNGDKKMADHFFTLSEEATRAEEDAGLGNQPGGTKFSKWQTPGGENYREFVLTFQGQGIEPYKDTHWEDPTDVWVRANDRTDADGKRTFFIEEIQSGRHQEGRKKGYGTEKPHYQAYYKTPAGEVVPIGFGDSAEEAINSVDPGWKPVLESMNAPIQTGIVSMVKTGGVPNAPFKQTWPMLAFKRMIQWASEHGYDQIAWTTGSMQNERYDLSKQIDAIEYRQPRTKGGDYEIVATKDGERKMTKDAKEDELEGIVGKEMAQKMVAGFDDNKSEVVNWKSISGVNLQIGGEGMKGFYDRILPSEVNKYVKQWGGRVGQTKITTRKAMDQQDSSIVDIKAYHKISDYATEGYQFADISGKIVSAADVKSAFDKGNRKGFTAFKPAQPAFMDSVHALTITPAMRAAVTGQGQMLFQGEKGSTEFTEDGKAILRGLASPDISTAIHEVAHVARRTLLNRDVPVENRAGITDADIKIAENWSGAANGNWSVRAEEKFARGLERHLRDNTSITGPMGKVFEKIAGWLKGIYQKIKGSPLDIRISKPMRELFDKIINRTTTPQAGAIPSDAAGAAGAAGQVSEKQPWEMTFEEYRAAVQERTGPKGQEDHTFFGLDDDSVGKAMQWHEERNRLEGQRSGQEILADPWGHKRIVENAIREGKSVPASVLEDYPDLQPNTAKRGAVPTESAGLQRNPPASASTPPSSGNRGYATTESVRDGKRQTIFKKNGKEIGEIAVISRPDGNLEVSNVLVWPESQRQGHATEFYRHAWNRAQSEGKKLYVSNDRTEDAKALHSRFEANGVLRSGGEIVFDDRRTTAPSPPSSASVVSSPSDVAPADGAKTKGKTKYSTYPINTSQGPRIAVQNGDKPGVGDTIHATQRAADEYVAKVKAMDEANATSRARDEARKKTEAEQKTKTDESLNEYLESTGHSAMQKGKVRGALTENASRRSMATGRIYQGRRDAVVREMIGDGWTAETREVPAIKEASRTQFNRMDGKEQAAYEKRRAEAGNKTEHILVKGDSTFTVTKAEHDYADWLTKKGSPDVRPKAEAPSDQPTTPSSDQPVREPVKAKRKQRIKQLPPAEQPVANQVEVTIERAERVAAKHEGTPHGEALKAEIEVAKTEFEGVLRQRGLPGMEDATRDIEAREAADRKNAPVLQELTELQDKEFANEHKKSLRALRDNIRQRIQVHGQADYDSLFDFVSAGNKPFGVTGNDGVSRSIQDDYNSIIDRAIKSAYAEIQKELREVNGWKVGDKVREANEDETLTIESFEITETGQPDAVTRRENGKLRTVLLEDLERPPVETVEEPQPEEEAAPEKPKIDGNTLADINYYQPIIDRDIAKHIVAEKPVLHRQWQAVTSLIYDLNPQAQEELLKHVKATHPDVFQYAVDNRKQVGIRLINSFEKVQGSQQPTPPPESPYKKPSEPATTKIKDRLRAALGDEWADNYADDFVKYFNKFDSLPESEKQKEYTANESRGRSFQDELGAKVTYAGGFVGLLDDGMRLALRNIREITAPQAAVTALDAARKAVEDLPFDLEMANTQMERRGYAEYGKHKFKVVPYPGTSGKDIAYAIEHFTQKPDGSHREMLSEKYDSLERAQDAAINLLADEVLGRAKQKPSTPKDFEPATTKIKANAITIDPNSNVILSKVPDELAPHLAARLKDWWNGGKSYMRLTQDQESLVERLDKQSPQKMPEVDVGDLDAQHSEANSAWNRMSSDFYRAKQAYDIYVGNEKSNFADKFGVPGQSRAKKWASKWAEAETRAKQTDEAKKLFREMKDAEANEIAAKAALETVRREREKQTAGATRKQLGEVASGTVLVSGTNANIAIRVGAWNEQQGWYDAETGATTMDGRFVSQGSTRLSPWQLHSGYVTPQQDADLSELREQVVDTAKKALENRNAIGEKAAAQRKAAVFREKWSQEVPKATIAQIIGHGDTYPVMIGDAKGITDGRFVLLEDAIPKNMKTRLEKVRPNDKYSNLKPPDAGSIVAGATTGAVPLRFVGYEAEATSDNTGAVYLTDGEHVVHLSASYYRYFTDQGFEFRGTPSAMQKDGMGAIGLFKDGKPVGALMPVGDEAQTLADLVEILGEKSAEPRSSAKEPVEKEPWQMTANDWHKTNEGRSKLDAATSQVRADDERQFLSGRGKPKDAIERRMLDAALKKRRDNPLNDFSQVRAELIAGHKASVRTALAEGKPVPAEVLAEYPDLKEPSNAVPAQSVEAQQKPVASPVEDRLAGTPKGETGSGDVNPQAAGRTEGARPGDAELVRRLSEEDQNRVRVLDDLIGESEKKLAKREGKRLRALLDGAIADREALLNTAAEKAETPSSERKRRAEAEADAHIADTTDIASYDPPSDKMQAMFERFNDKLVAWVNGKEDASYQDAFSDWTDYFQGIGRKEGGWRTWDAEKSKSGFLGWAKGGIEKRLVSVKRKAEAAHRAETVAGAEKLSPEEKAGVKPTEGQKAVQDAIDLTKSLAKKHGKRLNTPGGEFLVDMGRLTKAWLKAGVLTFRDYVGKLAEHFDADVLRTNGKAIEKMWQTVKDRGAFAGMSDAESVADVLDGFGEAPVAIEEPSAGDGKTTEEMLAPGADYVSTQNKYAAKVREELGMPERGPVDLTGHTWEDLNEQAAEIGPGRAVELLAELGDKTKPPRAVSDLENFILLRHLRTLQNDRLAAAGEIAEARESGESAREAMAETRLDVLDAQLKDFVEITEAIGTPAGRLLAARKAFLAMDYSLPKLEYDIEKAQQRPMTKEERTELKDLHTKYEALKKHAEEVEAKYEELKAQERIDDAIQVQTKPEPTRKQKVRVRFNKAAKSFFKHFATAHSLGSFSPEAFADAVELAKASVELGVATVQDFVDSVTKMFGKALTTDMDAALRKAHEQVVAESKIPPKLDFDAENANSLRRAAQEIMRHFIGQGVTNRDKLIDAVHEEFTSYLPEITRRETMLAMSGYGDVRPATNNPIELVRQDVNGQIQAVLKLEDMSHGIAPLHSGQQRNPQSDEKRRLEQQVNEEKRKGGFVSLDPETQLKSSLQARETWLKHRMEDLRFEISKGQRTVKTKTPTPTSPAIEALQAEYDLLKAEHLAVFGKRELTNKQKLEIATKHAAKHEAFWADQLAKAQAGTFPAEAAKKPPITSPELEAIRAKTKAAQAEFKRLDDAAHPEKKEDARYARAKANVEHWQQRLKDAQNGLFQPAKSKVEDSTGVTLLKSLAAHARAQAKELDDAAHPDRVEQLLNDRYLTSLMRQKVEIESRIANNDVAPRVREERKLTPEVLKARHERDQATAKLDVKKELARLEGRKTPERILDGVREGVNLIRDHRMNYDMGVGLLQGGVHFFSHPVNWWTKALPAGITTLFSKDSAAAVHAINEMIHEMPNAKNGLFDQMKEPFSQEGVALTRREELVLGSWLYRVPVLGRLAKRFSHAGGAFLNVIRAHQANYFLATVADIDGRVSSAAAKVVGKQVGMFTGRGDMGTKAVHVLGELNLIFNATQWVVSRFQLVLLKPLWMKGGTPGTLRAAQKEYGRLLMGLTGFYLAALALSATSDDEDDQPIIEFDPRSTEFLKLKYGGMSIDPLFGLQQAIVLMARLATKQKKDRTGKVLPLTAGGKDLTVIFAEFARGKLHPFPAFVNDMYAGQDITGEKVYWDDAPRKLGLPLTGEQILKSFDPAHIPSSTARSVGEWLGARVTQYETRIRSLRDADAEFKKIDKSLTQPGKSAAEIQQLNRRRADTIDKYLVDEAKGSVQKVITQMAKSPNPNQATIAQQQKLLTELDRYKPGTPKPAAIEAAVQIERQDLAKRASDALSTEKDGDGKLKSQSGSNKGKLRSLHPDAQSDDALTNAARYMLKQVAPTFNEQASLVRESWYRTHGTSVPGYALRRLPAWRDGKMVEQWRKDTDAAWTNRKAEIKAGK